MPRSGLQNYQQPQQRYAHEDKRTGTVSSEQPEDDDEEYYSSDLEDMEQEKEAEDHPQQQSTPHFMTPNPQQQQQYSDVESAVEIPNETESESEYFEDANNGEGYYDDEQQQEYEQDEEQYSEEEEDDGYDGQQQLQYAGTAQVTAVHHRNTQAAANNYDDQEDDDEEYIDEEREDPYEDENEQYNDEEEGSYEEDESDEEYSETLGVDDAVEQERLLHNEQMQQRQAPAPLHAASNGANNEEYGWTSDESSEWDASQELLPQNHEIQQGDIEQGGDPTNNQQENGLVRETPSTTKSAGGVNPNLYLLAAVLFLTVSLVCSILAVLFKDSKA